MKPSVLATAAMMTIMSLAISDSSSPLTPIAQLQTQGSGSDSLAGVLQQSQPKFYLDHP